MGVSKNRGTPKSSILIGVSIINHPFWGTPIFGNTQMLYWGEINPLICPALITGRLQGTTSWLPWLKSPRGGDFSARLSTHRGAVAHSSLAARRIVFRSSRMAGVETRFRFRFFFWNTKKDGGTFLNCRDAKKVYIYIYIQGWAPTTYRWG